LQGIRALPIALFGLSTQQESGLSWKCKDEDDDDDDDDEKKTGVTSVCATIVCLLRHTLQVVHMPCNVWVDAPLTSQG
jgi:hypothetical protein